MGNFLTGMIEKRFKSVSTHMESLVYFPATDSGNGRVILYLHGSGGFGTGIEGLFEYPDFPGLLRDGLELDSLVLIPSCHEGDNWQPGMITSFLDDFEKAFDRPETKYDIIGYSRGGVGAYRFAAVYPLRVRSLAAVSARPVFDVAPRLIGMPVMICHGLNDGRTPFSDVQKMHSMLVESGSICKLVLLDGDHHIIARVLTGGLIFDWQRQAAKND
jgi:pimeloyl-ACP methyl ester carboxylesterase